MPRGSTTTCDTPGGVRSSYTLDTTPSVHNFGTGVAEVAEQIAENRQEPDERQAPSTSVIAGQRSDLVTSNELRKAALPSQLFHGYRHREVEDLLERSAASIDELGRISNSLKSELNEARNAASAPEEIVTDMLAIAVRVVETAKQEAAREAADIVARARGEAEQIASLHDEAKAVIQTAKLEAAEIIAAARPEAEAITRAARSDADAAISAAWTEAYTARTEAESMLASSRAEAESTIAAARAESEALLSRARADRERVLDDATRDANEARAALEQEKAAIDSAINDLRDTWANRIGEAIARLDAIDPARVQTTGQADAPVEESGQPTEADLALQLQERVGGLADPAPSVTAETVADESDTASERR